MTIALRQIEARSSRRLRLIFTNTLDTGAFGLNPTLYSVTPSDASGGTPSIKAALIIASNPLAVELVLGDDMSSGAPYLVTITAVPCTDASTATGTQRFFYGAQLATQHDTEPEVDNGEILLYGIDIIWSGDFQETQSGDLARVGGSSNAVAALQRRVFANGLPYDRNYGPNARQFIDAPESAIGDLRSTLISQILLDDRVKKVDVKFLPDPDTATFDIMPTLIGDHQPEAISVKYDT